MGGQPSRMEIKVLQRSPAMQEERHYLDPSVRTVVDIGGQDSKVIRLDEQGNVVNFVMNDKCAAGTGRFLEMMARTMEMSLDQLGNCGIQYKEDITISSMCTVFAESEVVSLIAQNKETDDIVHGLNKAVVCQDSSPCKAGRWRRKIYDDWRCFQESGPCKNPGRTAGHKACDQRTGTALRCTWSRTFCC